MQYQEYIDMTQKAIRKSSGILEMRMLGQLLERLIAAKEIGLSWNGYEPIEIAAKPFMRLNRNLIGLSPLRGFISLAEMGEYSKLLEKEPEAVENEAGLNEFSLPPTPAVAFKVRPVSLEERFAEISMHLVCNARLLKRLIREEEFYRLLPNDDKTGGI
jgi:hypothetical protein